MDPVTYAQESFTVTTGNDGNLTGSFSFSASATYPQYPGGPHPLMGTFNGQQIVGFSTFGNPVNAVGNPLSAALGTPPDQNPYYGNSGILAQTGYLNDSSLQNGLSFTLADGTDVHIYVSKL